MRYEETDDTPIDVVIENAVESTTYDVMLGDIKKPALGDRYIVACTDVGDFDICYGIGYPSYLDLRSGLPGFGYPMLITFEHVEQSNSLRLVTEYGEYSYKFEKVENNFSDEIINFGIKEESVYVLSETDNICYIYTLEGGPSIGV